LLDLGVGEFHQHAVGARIGVPKQDRPFPNAKCEAWNASGTDIDGIGTFCAQKVGIHEQAIEEDFDATREHECCEK